MFQEQRHIITCCYCCPFSISVVMSVVKDSVIIYRIVTSAGGDVCCINKMGAHIVPAPPCVCCEISVGRRAKHLRHRLSSSRPSQLPSALSHPCCRCCGMIRPNCCCCGTTNCCSYCSCCFVRDGSYGCYYCHCGLRFRCDMIRLHLDDTVCRCCPVWVGSCFRHWDGRSGC